MAAFVQITGQAGISTGTTLTISVTNAPASGNTLIGVIQGVSGNIVSSVSDSRGNTWTVDETVNSNGSIGVIRGVMSTPLQAGDSITVHMNGSGEAAGQVYEYSGILTTSPIDVANHTNGNPASSLSANITTTVASDIILLAVSSRSAVTFTLNANYTNRGQYQNTGTVVLGDYTPGATGTYTGSATFASSASALFVIGYKVSAGTTYNQTATATATSSAGITNQIGATRTASATSTASATRSIGKTVVASAASAATAAVTKVRIVVVTAVATSSATIQRTLASTVRATATSAAGIRRGIAKAIQAAAASAGAVTRGISQTFAANATSTAAVTTTKSSGGATTTPAIALNLTDGAVLLRVGGVLYQEL